jgi:ABC-2 type transport system ATP-binding protein
VPMVRVAEVLDMVGMSTEAKRRPGKFSLGMSQRLGIAAAILGEPKYLVLDEPANGLDPEGIAWLRQFLKQYASKGNAVFISSHLLSEMSQMADDVVVIGKGKLIASATVDELIAHSTHSHVFVRADNLAGLKKALKRQSLTYEEADGGLTVAGGKTDTVGKLAFGAGITVLELSKRDASLEEAFLELTENAQEYRTHDDSQKGETK